jgi:Amt family ammonium transporter
MMYIHPSKKPDPGMCCNGILAGLVAITSPCAFVSPTASVIIGLVAGVLVVIAVGFVENKLKIDDPVGALSVHLVCGVFGTLCVGLFASPQIIPMQVGDAACKAGLFYGGGATQLISQLIGIGAVGATILGIVFFGESLSVARVGCIALIVCGILGLKLLGESAT